MASCCICLEEMDHTIVCADNHATCEECFETYLVNKTTDLGQTSMLAAKAEAAALAGDEGRLAPVVPRDELEEPRPDVAAVPGGRACVHSRAGARGGRTARPGPGRVLAPLVRAVQRCQPGFRRSAAVRRDPGVVCDH